VGGGNEGGEDDDVGGVADTDSVVVVVVVGLAVLPDGTGAETDSALLEQLESRRANRAIATSRSKATGTPYAGRDRIDSAGQGRSIRHAGATRAIRELDTQ
jgi:hypothetical protein